MGLCVALNPDGTLTPTGQTAEECTAYVLAAPAEHAQLLTLEQLFGLPDPVVAGGTFTAIVLFLIGAYKFGLLGGMAANVVR